MSMTEELTDWSWEQKCQKAVEALGTNGFTAVYCRTPGDARSYILEAAADAASIGFGGSMTITDLAVQQTLADQGKEILNHSSSALSRDQKMEIMRRQLTCDLFLSGSNALTISGELINIDATGNRVAAMFFGPRRVIVVVGPQQTGGRHTAGGDSAGKTVGNPAQCKRLSFNTPCAKTGFCSNCNSPDRLCRVTTIIDRKPVLPTCGFWWSTQTSVCNYR